MRARSRVTRSERGDAVVVWCLGLAVLMLPLGGISVDLWHAVSEERGLQAAAAAAAAAGADGLDTATYRSSGQVQLDPGQATELALQTLAAEPGASRLSEPPQIVVAPDHQSVSVVLRERLSLTLLKILLADRTIQLTATAQGSPRASGAP